MLKPRVLNSGAIGLLAENPSFRRLYVAELLSQGGDWFLIVPLLGLLLKLSGSPFWGGLILAADTVLISATSLFAGSLLNSINRRRLLVSCNVWSAACVSLAFAVHSEQTSVFALLAVSGVAVAKAFFGPTATAVVPLLVKRDSLLTATIMSGATWAVMLVVGSSVSAVLTAAAGPYWSFAVDAGSFLASAALVRKLPDLGKGGRSIGRLLSPASRIRDLVTMVRHDKRTRILIAAKPGPALGNGILAIFPVLVASVYHVGPAGVGLLFAARGVGALIGPLVAGQLARRVHPRTLIVWGMLLFALGYGIFPIVYSFAVAVACVTLAHAGGAATASMSTYGLQTVTSEQTRAGVFSADLMTQTVIIGVSQIGIVALASAASYQLACVGAAIMVLLYAVIWWRGSSVLSSSRTSAR